MACFSSIFVVRLARLEPRTPVTPQTQAERPLRNPYRSERGGSYNYRLRTGLSSIKPSHLQKKMPIDPSTMR
jgi:hypothetical protein